MKDIVSDIEKCRDEASQESGKSPDSSRRPGVPAEIHNHYCCDGGAQGETTFNGQVGKIEHAETEEGSKRDDSEDETDLDRSQKFIKCHGAGSLSCEAVLSASMIVLDGPAKPKPEPE